MGALDQQRSTWTNTLYQGSFTVLFASDDNVYGANWLVPREGAWVSRFVMVIQSVGVGTSIVTIRPVESVVVSPPVPSAEYRADALTVNMTGLTVGTVFQSFGPPRGGTSGSRCVTRGNRINLEILFDVAATTGPQARSAIEFVL